MMTLQSIRLDRDHEPLADILPESYLRSTAVREFLFPWPEQTFEEQFTELRSVWSEKYLYLHLWAKDSWIVPADDRLTLSLISEANVWTWTAVAGGAITSQRETSGKSEPRWKSQATPKVRRHDAGWTWEIRIPWAKDLGLSPVSNAVLGLLVVREDKNRQNKTSVSVFGEPVGEDPGPGWAGQLVLVTPQRP